MTATSLRTALPKSTQTEYLIWHPDSWCFRSVAITLAVAVSGLYALLLTEPLGILGAALLIGAGSAWPALLLGVWFRSEVKLRFARIDWCIWTMTVGSVAMTLGLLAAYVGQILWLEPLWILVGGLFIADVAMGWVFTRYAPAIGVRRLDAMILWIGGMNGFLMILLALLAITGN